MKYIKKILIILAICVLIAEGCTHNYHSSKYKGKTLKKYRSYKEHKGPKYSKQLGDMILKNELKMHKNMDVRKLIGPTPSRTSTGRKRGLSSIKYRQYYKNIPIESYGITATIMQNKLLSYSSTLVDSLEMDVTPALTEEQALNRALEQIGAEEYSWEKKSKTMERPAPEGAKCGSAKCGADGGPLAKVPKGKLLIADYTSNDYIDKDYVLIYRFDIRTYKPFSAYRYDIDANTGEIIGKNPNNPPPHPRYRRK